MFDQRNKQYEKKTYFFLAFNGASDLSHFI